MNRNQPVAIATCKYRFCPQNELEVQAWENESFQVLEDAGDGWLLAKPISRLGRPGLIPRSHCSLHTLPRLSISMISKSEHVLEIGGAEITSVCVKSVSNYENRLWYGIEMATSTEKTRYLSRYYQDFYILQLILVNAFVGGLPRLPEPSPQLEPGSALESRCKALNTYLKALFALAATSKTVKTKLEQWLQMQQHDVEVPGPTTPVEINSMLKHKAVVLPSNIVENLQLQIPELDRSTSSTPTSSPLLARTPTLTTLPFLPEKPVVEEEKIKVKVFHGDDPFIFKIAGSSSVTNLKMAISKQINLYNFKLRFQTCQEALLPGSNVSNLAQRGKLVVTTVHPNLSAASPHDGAWCKDVPFPHRRCQNRVLFL